MKLLLNSLLLVFTIFIISCSREDAYHKPVSGYAFVITFDQKLDDRSEDRLILLLSVYFDSGGVATLYDNPIGSTSARLDKAANESFSELEYESKITHLHKHFSDEGFDQTNKIKLITSEGRSFSLPEEGVR